MLNYSLNTLTDKIFDFLAKLWTGRFWNYEIANKKAVKIICEKILEYKPVITYDMQEIWKNEVQAINSSFKAVFSLEALRDLYKVN